MGIHINNKVIMQKEKEKADEIDKAMMMLEISDKEMELQQIQMENATIMMELAIIKGAK